MLFSLSVIVPAFNEEHSIEKTLNQIIAFLSHQDFNFEVIVVDDGSTDSTNEIVARRNDVQLVTLETNKGKGFAVKTGVLKSNNDFVLFMDADHTIPIDYVLSFKACIKDYDLVIGSKYLNPTENYPLYRKFVGKIFSRLKYLITGLKIKDTQCGFKLFKRHVALELFNLSQIKGWCFDVEILLLAQKKGYEVKEFPVKLSDTNVNSNISILNSGPQMVLDLLKLRVKFKKGDYNL
tara:strand:+ start:582 stop:1289 length:708 start_codon:yes stop_codon:yes gene_type:complete